MMSTLIHGDFESWQFDPGDEVLIAPLDDDAEYQGSEPEPPLSLDEWDAGDEPGPIPPRQWLLGDQFCRGFLSSIVSAGGGGKSALRLLQFISLALGRSLCGQHVFRRCRVLLVSLEDDRDELHRRIKAVLDYYSVDRAELKGLAVLRNAEARQARAHEGKGSRCRPARAEVARRYQAPQAGPRQPRSLHQDPHA